MGFQNWRMAPRPWKASPRLSRFSDQWPQWPARPRTVHQWPQWPAKPRTAIIYDFRKRRMAPRPWKASPRLSRFSHQWPQWPARPRTAIIWFPKATDRTSPLKGLPAPEPIFPPMATVASADFPTNGHDGQPGPGQQLYGFRKRRMAPRPWKASPRLSRFSHQWPHWPDLGSGLITNSVSDDRSGIWPWKHGMAVKTDLAVKTDHKQAILTFYAKVIFFAFLAQGLQLVVQFWPFWTMGWAMCPDASRSWFEKQWYVCVSRTHTHVCIVIYLYLVIYVNIYNCWFVWLQLSKKKHTNIMIQFTYTTHIAHVKKCSTWRRNNKKLVGWRVDGNIYVDEPNFIFSSGEVRRPHMLLGRSKIANRKSPIRPFTTKKNKHKKKKKTTTATISFFFMIRTVSRNVGGGQLKGLQALLFCSPNLVKVWHKHPSVGNVNLWTFMNFFLWWYIHGSRSGRLFASSRLLEFSLWPGWCLHITRKNDSNMCANNHKSFVLPEQMSRTLNVPLRSTNHSTGNEKKWWLVRLNWPALSLSEMLTISLPGRFISSTLPVPFLGSGVVVIKALIWHLWWTNVDYTWWNCFSGIWLRRCCSKGWIINWIWRTPMSLLIAAVNREISLRLPRHHWLRPLTKSKID